MPIQTIFSMHQCSNFV